MATRGREFSNSKRAGRNASEPMCSLVKQVEKPTLWSEGEGRWKGAGITEVAPIDSRGSRDGMFWKIYCPVLETRLWGWGDHRPLRIRQRKRSGCKRESEGFIVPTEIAGQHNPRSREGTLLCSCNRRAEQFWGQRSSSGDSILIRTAGHSVSAVQAFRRSFVIGRLLD